MFLMNGSLQSDPAAALFQAGNRISRALDQAFGQFAWQPAADSTVASWLPPVDIFEDAGAIRMFLEVPGVNPEDVKISLESNLLTIRGQKPQVGAQGTERVHRYERVYGAFERTFTVPTTVDAAGISATYHQGVLCVTLPKAEQARPREIQVQTAPAPAQLNA